MRLCIIVFLVAVCLAKDAEQQRRDSERAARIVGGTLVSLSSGPLINFQVGLQVPVPGGSERCGGTIVAKNFVVTAAHCVWNQGTNSATANAGDIIIRPGINYFDTTNQMRGKAFWVHPSYVAGSSLASQDIAVIELSGNLTFSNSVGFAGMSTATCTDCEVTGKNYLVSGYGLTICPSEGACNTLSDDLMYVAQQYVSFNTCQQRVQQNVGSSNVGIMQNSLCTGPVPPTSSGADSCQGDSGGPLVFDAGVAASPRYILAGVVAAGTQQTNPLCGVANQYGIYTSVQTSRTWIDQVMSFQLAATNGMAMALPSMAVGAMALLLGMMF